MKKDSIIGCLITITFVLFLWFTLRWQLALIGTLALILCGWAYSKSEEQLAKKIADEIKKNDEGQAIEETTGESECP